jgi:hypothetical protein
MAALMSLDAISPRRAILSRDGDYGFLGDGDAGDFLEIPDKRQVVPGLE